MKLFLIKAILLFAFCIAASQLIFSQGNYSVKTMKKWFAVTGTLSGKVTEKDKGHALAGATVYIPDLKLIVVSDVNGQYHFNSLPSGIYLVQVHYVGYKTIIKDVVINGSTVQDFELTLFAIEESPVVVTGQSQ